MPFPEQDKLVPGDDSHNRSLPFPIMGNKQFFPSWEIPDLSCSERSSKPADGGDRSEGSLSRPLLAELQL
jgi:hypothetical protein